MSPAEFKIIVDKIRPHTDYIYLHVLGEPLLHPKIEEILSIANAASLNINITTNGSLIPKKKDILLRQTIRQINISLHDAEENMPTEKWDDYLSSILDYAMSANDKTYVNLRLWNSGVESSIGFNHFCLDKIGDKFNKTHEELNLKGKDSGIKLTERVFLQHAPRFEWPDGEKERSEATKTCYALRDQIAVLAEGTVVPCCIDGDGNLKLGNLFTEELSDILQSPRAQKIRTGFINHTITENYCKTCGFFINQ